MGDVASGVTNLSQQTEFRGCNVYAKEDCATCWSKFYCGGGCSANAYNTHGNITTIYDMGCALEKKRVECAVFIKAKEMLENL